MRAAGEKWLLVRALAWLVAVRIALPLIGFAAVRRRVERGAWSAARAPVAPVRARWAVDAVANRLPRTRCLTRALSLHALLRRAGLSSRLRLGVARGADGAMRAHAWVELDGETLPVGGDSGYSPLHDIARAG